jgi:hypothetical protein
MINAHLRLICYRRSATTSSAFSANWAQHVYHFYPASIASENVPVLDAANSEQLQQFPDATIEIVSIP